MLQSLLLPLLAGVAAGLAAAFAFILLYTRSQRRSGSSILAVARAEAERLRSEGQRDAESTKSDLLLTAKMETLKLREDLDREIQRRREEWERLDRRPGCPANHFHGHSAPWRGTHRRKHGCGRGSAE